MHIFLILYTIFLVVVCVVVVAFILVLNHEPPGTTIELSPRFFLRSFREMAVDFNDRVSMAFKPDKSDLTGQILKVTEVDVTKNRLSNWWKQGQIESVSRIVAARIGLVKGLVELEGLQFATREKEIFEEARRQTAWLLIENQQIVHRNANALGIPVENYGEFTLELLKGQLQAKTKILEAQVSTESERISIEETFRASLTKASLVFENQQRLIKELGELETNLQNVDSENLPESVKASKKKRLQQLISVKEAELNASQQETLPQGDRN